MGQIDHLDLVVGSLDVSLPLYRELLGPLGWRWVHPVEGERGETIRYLFRLDGRTSIGLRERQPEGPPHDLVYDPDGIKIEVVKRRRFSPRAALWALRPSTTPFRPQNRGRPR